MIGVMLTNPDRVYAVARGRYLLDQRHRVYAVARHGARCEASSGVHTP